MNKLERSLRSKLNYYGPDLRHGYYKPIGWTGVINNRKGFKMLRDANVYYNIKSGKVIDVQLIGYGEAYDLRYVYDDDVTVFDVTEDVIAFLRYDEMTWDMLINAIIEQIEEFEESKGDVL